jgi:hypothetical protein
MLAQELADDHNRPTSVPEWNRWTGRDVANRLRRVVKAGLVEREEAGFWMLTARGRDGMAARRRRKHAQAGGGDVCPASGLTIAQVEREIQASLDRFRRLA